MANKVTTHSYNGMVKDISKTLYPNQFYFEGRNIRILSTDTQSTGSITNEKGNSLILTIPIPHIEYTINSISYEYNGEIISVPYTINTNIQPRNEIENQYFISNNNYRTSGTQIIIGHCLVRDNFILFTTDNEGFDCIWKVNDTTYELTLLYMRNLGFNSQYPIQALNNYENEIIDKIYWVDGNNQMRFINIYHSEENQDLENLMDLSLNNINMVGTFDLDQPEIIDINSGGIHTSGMIQYAYNLYKLNGSQTKISPLTELIPLTKGDNNGGGEINEIVGAVPVIKIDNIDNNYTGLKLYAIKYTSYNQLPSISLILDRDISSVNTITYYDDGNIIQSISLEEFLFLGSDIIIPKHINTKKNIMFLANYKEKNFDINTYNGDTSIDLRAYSFKPNMTSTLIYNSLEENDLGTIVSSEPAYPITTSTINGITEVPFKHSAININYDQYNRQYNNNIVGGEGAYIKYRIVRNVIDDETFTDEDAEGKFLKDNEIYRLSIQFYNKYGQNSLPKWIADFKNIIVSNQSNLNNFFASVEITLKPLFYIWLNDDNNFLDENGQFDEALKPVGYRLLRAERTILDRTILCQGLLNGMLAHLPDSTGADVTPNQIEKVNNAIKIPSMMRRFDDYLNPMWHNESYFRVDRFSPETHPSLQPGQPGSAGNEVYKSPSSSGWTFGTFQFNKLMQLFSPEIIFNTLQNIGQTKLNIVGGIQNDYNALWGQLRDVTTKIVNDEVKVNNAISTFDEKAFLPGNTTNLIGSGNNITGFGFTGPRDGTNMEFLQTYRSYKGGFISANKEYSIYGTPEITTVGQGRTVYNNDNNLIYYNSLQQLSTDTGVGSDDNPGEAINSVNTFGISNITVALGSNSTLTENRLGIEDLYEESNIDDTSVGLLGEFRIERNLIYLGNIYGGNTYESKKRSNYIEIGEYKDIEVDIYNCVHAGDTFISNFKFTKLVKTETEIYSQNSQQITEIVDVKIETTVDLKNRNDLSLTTWDNRFQPSNDEYQEYNTVYSQESNLIVRRDLDYKFKKVEGFDTTIISTKTKVPGEIIDSWTDLQPNNILTLDGKYGAINSLHSFQDEIYAFQDIAISFISILPRVQIQGDDGIEVELGSGQVLQQAKYISTDSGTKNKWSIVNSPSSFYYYDTLNKSINIFKQGIGGLSDAKGIHIYFINNIDNTILIDNNPVLNRGVSSGYDYINNDIFFTFLQNNKTFTISYNEIKEQFISFYDYHPSRWISKGSNFIITSPDNTQIFKQYEGEYQNYFGIKYPSYIILNVNPEPNSDCVFDTINYKSECYLDNIDQFDITVSKLQAYNEYQNSGLIPLTFGRNYNLRRKFRDWNALIPRQGRNRIRNPYIFLKLQFDPEENYKFILHNLNIFYTTY